MMNIYGKSGFGQRTTEQTQRTLPGARKNMNTPINNTVIKSRREQTLKNAMQFTQRCNRVSEQMEREM